MNVAGETVCETGIARVARIGRIESGDRRGEGVELRAVAKALKVDPVELFSRFVRTS